MEFVNVVEQYKKIAEDYFIKQLSACQNDNPVDDAVKYSFFGGGKRIRPVMMLATSEYLGLVYDEVLPFAFAMECIHEHSLIHDDLPALDNDDLRRGKSSCHKKFNEPLALLAGDYLLNFAYESCLLVCNTSEKIKALSEIARSADAMIRGQVLDTLSDSSLDEDAVISVYKKKTCALIGACFTIPALLAERKDVITDFEVFGYNLGILFQITDDLIDYNDSNFNENGLNYVELFGVKKALDLKNKVYFNCLKYADKYKEFTFLKLITDYISERSL